MVIWVLLLHLLSVLLALILASISSAVVSGRRSRQRAVGFFHPYTNDGGGGERVLWCAVRAMQEERPGLICAVYTGDDASPQNLAACALDRFGVELLRPPQRVHFLMVVAMFHIVKPSHCLSGNLLLEGGALVEKKVDRGTHVSPLHYDRTESWFSLSSMGGFMQI